MVLRKDEGGMKLKMQTVPFSTSLKKIKVEIC